MANGHKLWIERYTTLMIGVFCTLGSVVYFTQIQRQYPSVHNIVALETQVKDNTAQTVLAVKQVKKESSKAEGSAVVAQAAAMNAQQAADVAAQHRAFVASNAQKKFEMLEAIGRSNRRRIETLEDQVKALQQGR